MAIYKLVCGKDPVKLGIADADGTWDPDSFSEHLRWCKDCRAHVYWLTQSLSLPLESLFLACNVRGRPKS